jgi:DNA-binding MarR family transcriptional regulator
MIPRRIPENPGNPSKFSEAQSDFPELPLWLQLNKVSRRYMEALSKRLGQSGIERHYFLLLAIGNSKGKHTQQELADLLETDKVSMTGILNYLARVGFVLRQPGLVDRRERRVVLTPKAVRALPEIRRAILDLNRKALSGLPRDFAEFFPEALLRIRGQLKTESTGRRSQR